MRKIFGGTDVIELKFFGELLKKKRKSDGGRWVGEREKKEGIKALGLFGTKAHGFAGPTASTGTGGSLKLLES